MRINHRYLEQESQRKETSKVTIPTEKQVPKKSWTVALLRKNQNRWATHFLGCLPCEIRATPEATSQACTFETSSFLL